MENNKTIFSYLFIEKEFKTSFEEQWLSVSERVAHWLCDVQKKYFPNKDMYYFYISPSFINTRINMYKYKKGKLFNNLLIENGSKVIYKEETIDEKEISFWEIVLLNEKSLPFAINESRNSCEVCIFFSDRNNIDNFPYNLFLLKDHKKNIYNISQEETMNFLVKKDFVIIRTWGSHDDRELWCRVFS